MRKGLWHPSCLRMRSSLGCGKRLQYCRALVNRTMVGRMAMKLTILIGELLRVVFEKLQALEADAAEARASKIFAGLGFSIAMQERFTKAFNGGWRMRISLARPALFKQPTLLFLDEPTNHLDLRAVMWLEQSLERWKTTLIVVSHDREFLNSVPIDIIHLHDLKVAHIPGQFRSFLRRCMYEQKRRENNKKYEVYEKQTTAAKRSESKCGL